MQNSGWIGEVCGMLSLFIFIVANVYYPARLIANQHRPWPRDVAIFFKKYLDLHMWLNVVAFVLMTIHAAVTNDRNIFLYCSLLVTVWLTLAGILMRSKRFTSDTKKQMRLIHTQQAVFLVWLAVLIVGHLLV